MFDGKLKGVRRWQGTFRDYLQMIESGEVKVRNAHQYLLDMLMSEGVQEVKPLELHGETTKVPKKLTATLFGVETTITKIIEYFQAGATGSEVGRRILLLIGPPSSGKSHFAIELKRGLEKYSRTPEGALYGIKGCPLHEDPLHLIPLEYRDEFYERYGIRIEGELCPLCRWKAENEWDDLMDVEVEQIFLSEPSRIGIGTFVPSDKKDQSLAELVGGINLAKVGVYGSENDPRAFDFNGEIEVANRGLLEMIEMLKVAPQFLYTLLTLAQEKNFKIPRFGLVYADEVVLAHTNMAEYNEFISNPKNEALVDRMYVVKFPYVLKYSEEKRIYEKLLEPTRAKYGVHIEPETLDIIAMFSVMTRIQEPTKSDISVLDKVKLYNGESTDNYDSRWAVKLRKEAPDEGMDGLSPRQVINALDTLAADRQDCLPCIKSLAKIQKMINELPSISDDQVKRWETFISDVREEYIRRLKRTVQKALYVEFEEEARTLLNNYLRHVEAYLEDQFVINEFTGEEEKPDERLMRRIEEKIGITETEKDVFRAEVMKKVGIEARKGKQFDLYSHPKLSRAIEEAMFEDRRSYFELVVSGRIKDEEEKKKVSALVQRLIDQYGFCEVCAKEAIQFLSSLTASDAVSKK